ncbi:MAG TPA: hemerythrin domain-containing protein [Candidatus Binatia bacterium]
MPQQADALSMLKADHDKVRGLLAQLEKSTERSADKREELLARIALELEIHTTLEEEIFYPAYRDAVKKREDRKLYQEAIEEHHVVDLVMPEIEDTDPGTEVFSAKAKVLKDVVEHHAEEEETRMFPRARKVMEADELKKLAARMEARKTELQGQQAAGTEEEIEEEEEDEELDSEEEDLEEEEEDEEDDE